MPAGSITAGPKSVTRTACAIVLQPVPISHPSTIVKAPLELLCSVKRRYIPITWALAFLAMDFFTNLGRKIGVFDFAAREFRYINRVFNFFSICRRFFFQMENRRAQHRSLTTRTSYTKLCVQVVCRSRY